MIAAWLSHLLKEGCLQSQLKTRIVLYGVGMDLSQIYHVETITISGDKDSGIECSVDFTNDITQ